MSNEMLDYVFIYIDGIASFIVALNVILVIATLRYGLKENLRNALLITGLVIFQVALNYSPMIEFSHLMKINSLLFILSAFVLSLVLVRQLDGILRWALFGLPVLLLLIYGLNFPLVPGEEGRFLFSSILVR